MLVQFLLNGVIAGSAYSLLALSFVLIYSLTRFFNFAHGAAYATGAYVVLALVGQAGVPLPLAVPMGMVGAGLLGLAVGRFVYLAGRRRGATRLVLMLVSLGLYVVFQNTVSLVFGDEVRSLRAPSIAEGLQVFGARITVTQLAIVSVAVVSFLGMSLVLRFTNWGRAVRAVASDAELASVSGIESNRVVLGAFAVGSALAGLAGVLAALDTDATPTMGMNALMMAVIAVIVGGIDSIAGAVLGGMLLGLAQHLGVWQIGSQWQDAIAFAILLFFLLVRPHGFLGRPAKEATV